jgi:hypothetical protein
MDLRPLSLQYARKRKHPAKGEHLNQEPLNPWTLNSFEEFSQRLVEETSVGKKEVIRSRNNR